MVGRSNVGKSSLVNALLGSALAHVSKEPGKTQALHFYEWPERKRVVVDLPGYGFAKVSQSKRDHWAQLIEEYFRADPGLECVFALMDARVAPSDLDMELLRFLSRLGKPVKIILTKTDQLKTQSERAVRRREIEADLSKFGVEPGHMLWVSVKSKDGVQALLKEFA
jgi:GTP-binding protein